jgi:hypothetical protein
MENARQRRMRARTGYWRLFTREDIDTALGCSIADSQSKLEALDEALQEYAAPPLVFVEDKTTGIEHRLAALESFIRQLPDGSIVISDGYGGEIRMRRGVVEIGAAVDIRLRPGRDLIEMVPRTRVMNVGGNIQIQSAKESVSLKAEKNLTCLSGQGEDGGVRLLENRSERDADAESWKEGLAEGKPIGQGIIVRSRKSLAVLGTDMYFGVQDSEDTSADGLRRTKAGSFVIDGCGGVLSLLGKQVMVQGSSGVTLVASDGSAGAALAVSTGGIQGVGNSFSVGVSTFAVGSPQPFTTRILDASGMQERRITLPSGDVTMSVGGNIAATGEMQVGGGVSASSVRGTTGRFGNASGDSGLSGVAAAPRVRAPTISVRAIEAATEAFGQNADPANNPLYTGAVLNGTAFSYISSEGLNVSPSSLVWAALRWQSMLQESEQFWEERPVTDANGNASYVYPGAEAWQSAQVQYTPDDGKSMLSGYIINTAQP